MRSELHCHTVYSDGIKTPKELLALAAEAGISVLSITDHDSVDGGIAAQVLPHDGIRLIPGIEISSQYSGRDVHMLGYYIDAADRRLSEKLAEGRSLREERALKVASNLEAAGFPISASEIKDSGDTVNRTTVARRLVAAGCVKDVAEAYDTLIGEGCPYFADRDDISAAEAAELIASCGGLPVIAHPWAYHVEDAIEPLMEHGLAGVEAYHTDQPLEEARRLEAYAKSLGLLVTGGSDWHGDAVHKAPLGSSQLPADCLEAFLAADPR